MSTDIDRMRQAQPAGRRPSAGTQATDRRPPPPVLSTEAARQNKLDNDQFDKQAAEYAKPTTTRPALITQAEIEHLRKTWTLGAGRLEMLIKGKNIREAVWQEMQGEEPLTVVNAADRVKAKEFFEKHGTRLADTPRLAPDNPLKPKPTVAATAPAPASTPDPAAGGASRPEPRSASGPLPESAGARPGLVTPPPASLKIEFLSSQGFRCELTLQALSSTSVLEQGSAAMTKLLQLQAKPAPTAAIAGPARAESSADEAKVCPVHKKPMKENRFKWFCPERDEQQESGFCAYEVPKKKR